MLHFAEHGSVSGTCAHFTISRSTFYRWLKRFDPADYNTLTDHPTRPVSENSSRVPEFPNPNPTPYAPHPNHCPLCRLTHWLRAPSLRSVTTLVLVVVMLNIALLLLVLPVAAGATGSSSWNPSLLVNTEAFQTIDDADATANVSLKFGEGLQESLTYNRSTSQFEFTRSLQVGGNLTATGSLSIKNVMSGSTLRVDKNADVWGNLAISGTTILDGNVGIGTAAPEAALEVVGTISGSMLHAAKNLTSSGGIYIDYGGSNRIMSVNGSLETLFSVDNTLGFVSVVPAGGAFQISGPSVSDADLTTPAMTSDSAPTPYATAASTIFAAGYEAYRAFDHNVTSENGWASQNGQTTGWITFDFGTNNGKIVTSYTIRARHYLTTEDPKSWTFDGSNDNSSWTTIDTQTNVAAWSVLEKRTYAVNNVTNYRYYRVNVTANQGGTIVVINEIELIGSPNSSASTFYVNGANSNVGIGTASPGSRFSVSGSTIIGNNLGSAAAEPNLLLEVTGTASGQYLHAEQGLTSSGTFVTEGAAAFGSTIKLNGVTYTFPGSDGTASGKVLKTDSAGNLSWSTDNDVSGINAVTAEGMFVNQGGDTMTGALQIRPATTGEAELEVEGTASGKILSFGDRLTGSGAVSIRTLTDSTTAFQVMDSDGGNPVFNIDTTNERVGIGTAAPETALEVTGTMSGTSIHAEQSLTSSGTITAQKIRAYNTMMDYAPSIIAGSNSSLANILIGNANTGEDGLNIKVYNSDSYITNDANTNLTLSTNGHNLVLGSDGVLSHTGKATVADTITTSGSLAVESNAAFGGTIKLGGVTYTFPVGDGTASGKVLKTNAAGQLSWSTDSTGSSTGLDAVAAEGMFVNQGGDTMTGALKINDSGSSSGGVLLNVLGTMSGRSLQVTGTGATPLIFTNVSNGRVGIGTNTPAIQGLHIAGAGGTYARIGNTTSNTRADIGVNGSSQLAVIGYNDTTSQYIDAVLKAKTWSFLSGTAGGTQGLYQDASGNVGIGTTAPNAKLSVAGTASGRILSFGDRLTGSGAVSIRTLTDSATAFQVLDSDGGNPVFNIDTTNERVGIGTAAPETALEVTGTMSGRFLQITGTGASPMIYTHTSNGNVGIKTSNPAYALDIAGDLSVTRGGAASGNSGLRLFGDNVQTALPSNDVNSYIINTGVNSGTYPFDGLGNLLLQPRTSAGNARDIVLATGDTTAAARVVVKGAGNVGIGTTTPNAKLSVAGTASGRILSFGSRLTGSGAVSIRTLTDSTTAFQVLDSDGGNPVFNIDTTNERVGIGTAAPETALEVTGAMSGRSLQITGTGASPLIYTDVSNGRVGIGTTSPNALLEVSGALAPQSRLTWTNNASYAQQLFYEGSTMKGAINAIGSTFGITDRQNDIEINSVSGDINFVPGNAQQVVFKSSGNVGIGTATPNVSLSVAGTASGRILSFGSRLTGSGAVSIRTLTDSVTAFQVLDSDGGTPVFNIDTTNERVGIGTASPSYSLDVAGDVRVGTAGGASNHLAFNRDGYNYVTANAGASAALAFVTGGRAVSDANSNLVLRETGNSYFQNGNVGIGTAGPTDTNGFGRALDIQSSNGGGAYFRDSDDTSKYATIGFAGSLGYIGTYGASTALSIQTSGSEKVRVDSSGNVGIGTTAPNAKLSVAGTASGRILSFGQRLTGSGAVSIRTLTDSVTAFQVLDSDGGTPVFNIDTTNERVGIGTASPSYPLDVVGEIRSNNEIRIYKNGSDSVTSGANYYLANDGNTRAWTQQLGADNDIDYWYYDGSSWERKATLQTTGSLGLGTTTPNAKLSVAGTASGRILSFGDRLTGSGAVSIRTLIDSTTAFQVFDSDGGAPVFNIDTTNERVGIGTASPQQKFWVNVGSDQNIGIYSHSSVPGIVSANDTFGSYVNMKIDASSLLLNSVSNGNVGIGTTTPTTKLEVIGTISGSQLSMGNATTSGSIIYSSGSTLMATAKGSSGQVLVSKGTGTPLWQAPTSAMLWYIDGSLAIGTKQGATVVMPYGFTCTDVDLRVDTAPVGANLIIDINKDGGTIFSINPEIDDGATAEDGNHVFSTTDLPAGSVITLDIDQIGSGTAGSDLTVILKGTRKY